ncbi:hypothetical protein GCM10022239_16560 [Leifsonia bigeumensis]|uniref:Uncharacterized protein n=1 Tax=Leifsonella bigeumensis TaxID=433643 RepID=A0ABP7FQS8_9MICO
MSRPDEASASVAPTAWSPAMTRANDVAKPAMEPTTPAEMGCRMGYRSFAWAGMTPSYGVKTLLSLSHDSART